MSVSPLNLLMETKVKEEVIDGSNVEDDDNSTSSEPIMETATSSNTDKETQLLPKLVLVKLEDEDEVQNWGNSFNKNQNILNVKEEVDLEKDSSKVENEENEELSASKKETDPSSSPKVIKRGIKWLPKVREEWVHEREVVCSICLAETETISELVVHLDREHKIKVNYGPIVSNFKDGDEGLLEEANEMEKVSQLLMRSTLGPRILEPLPPIKTKNPVSPNSESTSEEESSSESSDSDDDESTDKKERDYIKLRTREVRRLQKIELSWEQRKNAESKAVLEEYTQCFHCFLELPRGEEWKVKRVFHNSGHRFPKLYKICPHCLCPNKTQAQLDEHLEELQVPVVGKGTPESEMKDLLFSEHKCPETGCDKTFSARRCLLWHRTAVHNPHAHRCPHCEKPFVLYHQMRKHVESAHNWEKRALQCTIPYCGKYFSTKTGIRFHKVHAHKQRENEEEIAPPTGAAASSYFSSPTTIWKKRAELRELKYRFEPKTDKPKDRRPEAPAILASTAEVVPSNIIYTNSKTFSRPRASQLTSMSRFFQESKPIKAERFDSSEEDEEEYLNEPSSPIETDNHSAIKQRVQVYKGKKCLIEIITGVESIAPFPWVSASNKKRHSIAYGPFQIYCHFCSRIFKKPEHRDAHVSLVHGVDMRVERPFLCPNPDCDVTCGKGLYLIRHLRQSHPFKVEESLLQKSLAEDKAFMQQCGIVYPETKPKIKTLIKEEESSSEMESDDESNLEVSESESEDDNPHPLKIEKRGRKPSLLTSLLLKFRSGLVLYCPECPVDKETPRLTWAMTNPPGLHNHLLNHHPKSVILKDPGSVRVEFIREGEKATVLEPGVFQVIKEIGDTDSDYLSVFSDPVSLSRHRMFLARFNLKKSYGGKVAVCPECKKEMVNTHILQRHIFSFHQNSDWLKKSAINNLSKGKSAMCKEDKFQNTRVPPKRNGLEKGETLLRRKFPARKKSAILWLKGTKDILKKYYRSSDGRWGCPETGCQKDFSMVENCMRHVRINHPDSKILKKLLKKNEIKQTDYINSMKSAKAIPSNFTGAIDFETALPLSQCSSLTVFIEQFQIGENMFACPIPGCDRTYTMSDNVHRHLRMNHKDDPLLNEAIALKRNRRNTLEDDVRELPKKKTKRLENSDGNESSSYSETEEEAEPPKQKKKGKYPCPKCGHIFNYATHLDRHVKNVVDCDVKKKRTDPAVFMECRKGNERLYQCPLCSFNSDSLYKFGRHVFVNHPNTELAERISEAKIESLVGYQLSKRKCRHCGKVYQNPISVQRHMKVVHRTSVSVKTIIEDRKYFVEDSSDLENREMTVKTEQETEAIIIPLKKEELFEKDAVDMDDDLELPPPSLENDTNNMEVSKQLSDIPPKKGANSSNLTCLKCGVAFVIESKYLAHITKNNCSVESTFSCHKCGRNFGSEWNMKRHVQRKACFYYRQARSKPPTNPKKIPQVLGFKSKAKGHVRKLGRLPKPKLSTNEKKPVSSQKVTQKHVESDPDNSDDELPPPGFEEMSKLGKASQPRKNFLGNGKGRKSTTDYTFFQPYKKVDGFNCPFCQEVITERYYFARHLLLTHPGTELTSQVSAKRISGLIGLERVKYKCDICDSVLACAYYLFVHFKKIHNRNLTIDEVIDNLSLIAPEELEQFDGEIEIENSHNYLELELQSPQPGTSRNDTSTKLNPGNFRSERVNYKCSICQRVMTTASKLSIHFKKVHNWNISVDEVLDNPSLIAFEESGVASSHLENTFQSTSKIVQENTEIVSTLLDNPDDESVDYSNFEDDENMPSENEQDKNSDDEEDKLRPPKHMRRSFRETSVAKTCRENSSDDEDSGIKKTTRVKGKANKLLSSLDSMDAIKCPFCGEQKHALELKQHIMWHKTRQKEKNVTNKNEPENFSYVKEEVGNLGEEEEHTNNEYGAEVLPNEDDITTEASNSSDEYVNFGE